MERMTERLPNNNNKNQKDEPANESPLKKVLHTLKQQAKLQSNKKRLIATSLSRISNLIQMNSNSKESQDKDDVNAPMVIDLCDDDDEKTKTSSSSQQQQHLRKHMEDCKAGVVVNPLGKRDALEGIEPEPKKPKLDESSTTNTIESAFQWDGTFHKSTPEPVNLSNEESMDVSTTNEVLKTDADSIKGQQVGDEATRDITTGSAQEAHCNPFIAENSDADEGSTENEHSSKNVEDPPKKSVCETAMVPPSESLERNDDGQGFSGETCERGSDSFAGNSNRDSESSENDNLSKIVLPSIALETIQKDDDDDHHHQCLPEEETSERPPELVANDSKQDQEGADENSQVQHEDVVTLLLGEEQQDCFQQEGHVTLDHTATDETKAIPDEKPLVEVSARQAIALGLPLILLAGLFSHVGLVDLSGSILEGYFRAFLQLHLLGCMLSPIFKYGSKRPIFVSAYALFMIILASYEASSRTKYIHDQQFYIIVRSLLFSVGWVAIWAFGVVLKPRPFWNPRYFLPIVGMLLGNSINGISIALDTITTGLVEKHAEIDLYLTFGATQFEAVAGIVSYAIQKGAMPCINMMCVVGIVSIPGMMTGQILGGSRPMVAARYQAMIIFLIASSTLSTIVTSSYLTIVSVFSEQTLQPDRLGKNRTRSLARLILHVWGCLFGDTSSKTLTLSNPSARALSSEMGPVCDASSTPFARFEVLEISPANTHRQDDGLLMAGENLGKFFLDENKDAPPTEQEDASLALEEKSPVLFHNLDMALFNGEMRAIVGPSGSGKSQLLKSLAGLNPLECGTLRLEGGEWGKDLDVLEWRKKVRYVTQHKVQIPGTPRQFVHTILSFRSRRLEGWNFMDFILLVAQYIQRWGISDPMTALDKEWSVLSGGESQRILLAIAMASNPSVLLLDESTSALDHEAKLAVEASVREFVEDRHVGALWVSHDEAQTQRMMMI